jgi:phosphoribosylaminoimidazole carboxylase
MIPEYQARMKKYQISMEDAVIEKGNKLRSLGDIDYLEAMAKVRAK